MIPSTTQSAREMPTLDVHQMLLDAARFAEGAGKPEWAIAARKAVAAATVSRDREACASIAASYVPRHNMHTHELLIVVETRTAIADAIRASIGGTALSSKSTTAAGYEAGEIVALLKQRPDSLYNEHHLDNWTADDFARHTGTTIKTVRWLLKLESELKSLAALPVQGTQVSTPLVLGGDDIQTKSHNESSRSVEGVATGCSDTALADEIEFAVLAALGCTDTRNLATAAKQITKFILRAPRILALEGDAA